MTITYFPKEQAPTETYTHTMSHSNRVMKEALDEAKEIVCGPRQEAYGLPEINHGRTARFWSISLETTITPRQVCVMNALQKLAREVNCHSRDNLIDVIGFCANAIACEAAAEVNGT